MCPLPLHVQYSTCPSPLPLGKKIAFWALLVRVGAPDRAGVEGEKEEGWKEELRSRPPPTPCLGRGLEVRTD